MVTIILTIAFIMFVIMFVIIIGLFNSYRNVIEQYNLQIALNRKIIDVLKNRSQLLDDNIQW